MRDRGAIVFIALSVALVVLSMTAAIVSIAHEGLGANGAAWVQAGGSIAAIAGAIWLSRREAFAQRRERRVKAEEIAWEVRFALTNAQFEAQTIAIELVDEHLAEKENPIRHWLLRSENCRNVLEIFAKRTDHLHPVMNHIASNGALLLRQMDEDIGRAARFLERGERPSIEVVAAIARYEVVFEELLELLDDRMRRILRTLDENSDLLPVSRMENWRVPKKRRSSQDKVL